MISPPIIDHVCVKFGAGSAYKVMMSFAQYSPNPIIFIFGASIMRMIMVSDIIAHPFAFLPSTNTVSALRMVIVLLFEPSFQRYVAISPIASSTILSPGHRTVFPFTMRSAGFMGSIAVICMVSFLVQPAPSVTCRI